MAIVDTLANGSDERVFETPRGTRAKVRVLAALTGLLFSLAAFCVAVVSFAAALELGVHWSFGAAVGLLAVIVVMYVGMKAIQASLRFRIVLAADSLVIGRGRLSCTLAYDEVETIMLPVGRNEHGIWLRSPGKRAHVLLSPGDETPCAAFLRRACLNAVFIDRSAREHLPRGGDRPSLTLRTLHRRCAILAWISLLCSLVTAAVAVLAGMELFGAFRRAGPNLDLDRIHLFAANVVTSPLFAGFALRKWRQAYMIGAKLSEFEQHVSGCDGLTARGCD